MGLNGLCEHHLRSADIQPQVHAQLSAYVAMAQLNHKDELCTRKWGVGKRTKCFLAQSSGRHMCLSLCPSLLRRCLFAYLKGLYNDWRCCTSRPTASSRTAQRGR
jgi:hypothetical protein